MCHVKRNTESLLGSDIGKWVISKMGCDLRIAISITIQSRTVVF